MTEIRWAQVGSGSKGARFSDEELVAGRHHRGRGMRAGLGEAAKPCAILTTATLALRDLRLLVDAAAHASVRANRAIGTLDETVWRATEPGSPHPRRRVEAVRTLNEAGIPCGVLVAPVLPGLSDTDDQLGAVVDACVEAGGGRGGAPPLPPPPAGREDLLRGAAG